MNEPTLPPGEMELPEDIREALDEMCEQGEEAMDEQEPAEALLFFRQSVKLLPPPPRQWAIYGWLCAAQGDAHYAMREFAPAREMFAEALSLAAPEEADPFILLRLGQCCRRLGDEENAAAYLRQAYEMEGEELFADAEDDLAFLQKAGQSPRTRR